MQILIASLLSAILLFQDLKAQGDSLQKQINDQVWKPFIKSFNSGDEEGFKAIHSRDMIRVLQDNQQIFGYERYFQKTPDSVRLKWGNWEKEIELRFLQRIAGNDKAFEVGFYKTRSFNPTTGESRTGYGKFHVLLRKEEGRWKILMDADANEGTNESVFEKARPMD
jgi:ketosteroid isomerase-like protein